MARLAAVRCAHQREIGVIETAVLERAGLDDRERLCRFRRRARERHARGIAERVQQAAARIDDGDMREMRVLDRRAAIDRRRDRRSMCNGMPLGQAHAWSPPVGSPGASARWMNSRFYRCFARHAARARRPGSNTQQHAAHAATLRRSPPVPLRAPASACAAVPEKAASTATRSRSSRRRRPARPVARPTSPRSGPIRIRPIDSRSR